MSRLPSVGRLARFIMSFVLIALVHLASQVAQFLPSIVLRPLYVFSQILYEAFSSSQDRRSRGKQLNVVKRIRNATNFIEMCALFGYHAEEHTVQTADGYLLRLHRLVCKLGEQGPRVNSGANGVPKRIVYLQHGLFMSSEVWVCLTEKDLCLPFELVDRGFDVWLGNNRGNKYSKRARHCSPTSTEFWNFSMDQFVLQDIPRSIAYVLRTTGQPSLSFIGFSQGAALAFAALSIFPELNEQVNALIALAPAMSPAGLDNGIIGSLVQSAPEVVYLAFGRRSILESTGMWQKVLYPPVFVRVIDWSLASLFNWTTRNISMHQKLAAYPRLYSSTSTKSVLHWFQIIGSQTFGTFNEDCESLARFLPNGKRNDHVMRFPTSKITSPVTLVYGGSDGLIDIDAMRSQLPKDTATVRVSGYEHLDFLWAHDVHRRVFPHVLDALELCSGSDGSGETAVASLADLSTVDAAEDGDASPLIMSPTCTALVLYRPNDSTAVSDGDVEPAALSSTCTAVVLYRPNAFASLVGGDEAAPLSAGIVEGHSADEAALLSAADTGIDVQADDARLSGDDAAASTASFVTNPRCDQCPEGRCECALPAVERLLAAFAPEIAAMRAAEDGVDRDDTVVAGSSIIAAESSRHEEEDDGLDGISVATDEWTVDVVSFDSARDAASAFSHFVGLPPAATGRLITDSPAVSTVDKSAAFTKIDNASAIVSDESATSSRVTSGTITATTTDESAASSRVPSGTTAATTAEPSVSRTPPRTPSPPALKSAKIRMSTPASQLVTPSKIALPLATSPISPLANRKVRTGSIFSTRSLDSVSTMASAARSPIFAASGITLGASRAVSGVIEATATGVPSPKPVEKENEPEVLSKKAAKKVAAAAKKVEKELAAAAKKAEKHAATAAKKAEKKAAAAAKKAEKQKATAPAAPTASTASTASTAPTAPTAATVPAAEGEEPVAGPSNQAEVDESQFTPAQRRRRAAIFKSRESENNGEQSRVRLRIKGRLLRY